MHIGTEGDEWQRSLQGCSMVLQQEHEGVRVDQRQDRALESPAYHRRSNSLGSQGPRGATKDELQNRVPAMLLSELLQAMWMQPWSIQDGHNGGKHGNSAPKKYAGGHSLKRYEICQT